MKRILILLIVGLASIVSAIPSGIYILMEQTDGGVSYSLEGRQTSDFDEFSTHLTSLLEMAKMNTEPQRVSDEVYCKLAITGNVDLEKVTPFQPLLSPYGFDHFTIHPLPDSTTEILITIGEPKESQLTVVMKQGKPENIKSEQ